MGLDETVVRPFALVGGRTGQGRADFDLMSVVDRAPAAAAWTGVPEQDAILAAAPRTVAELAADLDLPIGVVRVLLGDLLENGLIVVRRPAPFTRVIEEVIDGLHAL
jgi:Protein of unknown function (DUF742)